MRSGDAPEGVRLPKFLSRAGVASRREAEKLIRAGAVEVNGVVVREPGKRIDPGRDVVVVRGSTVTVPPSRWVAFHKPAGVLTTAKDTHGRRTLYDALPPSFRSLRYVGRLDRDTSGLLLLTNRGDLARELTLPRSGVPREYWVRVAGVPSREILERLEGGVVLDDGPARAEDVRIVSSRSRGADLMLVLREGRKREVRRLCEAVGHQVRALRRVRFGPIELGSLPPGGWRELTEQEIDALEAAARPSSGVNPLLGTRSSRARERGESSGP